MKRMLLVLQEGKSMMRAVLCLIAAFCCCAGAHAAQGRCKDIVVTNRAEIHSDTVTLHEVIGGKVKAVKSLKSSAFLKNGSVTLQDCEALPRYLIWRTQGRSYLVEETKFKCIPVQSTGTTGDRRPAGTPGSGGKACTKS